MAFFRETEKDELKLIHVFVVCSTSALKRQQREAAVEVDLKQKKLETRSAKKNRRL